MSASKARSRIPAGLDIKSGSPTEVTLAFLEARTRRHFLRSLGGGLGTLFLGTLASKLAPSVRAAGAESDALDFSRDPRTPLSPLPPQFPAKVRRVIYLHMAGAPSQLELFEHKPELKKFDGQDCPASFLAGKRFAFISGVPKLLGSQYPFHQAGQSGQWISDRLPHIEKQVDEICFIKSMHTDSSIMLRRNCWCRRVTRASDMHRSDRGLSTVWARRIRICRALSCCFRAARRPMAGSNCGVLASFPACTRECSAAPTASPCCIWTIPQV